MKREQWTEIDLDNLAAEESDIFERKSGAAFNDQSEFLNIVAKALSAFANSGGGSLIIGVKDDGTPDGLPPIVGRTAMKDWIEQKVPGLLDYPLSDFRVHAVTRSNPSRIPTDREVIVVDVGDSAAAPHQSKRDQKYYYRVGGRSEPARHFYLELLRQRLSNPTLEANLKQIDVIDAHMHDGGIFVETDLVFEIKNIGRVASYNWNLRIRQFNVDDSMNERKEDYYFSRNDFPKRGGRSTGIPINTTILPGCEYYQKLDFGVQLRPTAHTVAAMREEINLVLGSITLFSQLATETSPGELLSIPLEGIFNLDVIQDNIIKQCPEFLA